MFGQSDANQQFPSDMTMGGFGTADPLGAPPTAPAPQQDYTAPDPLTMQQPIQQAAPVSDVQPNGNTDELLSIKQDALQQLSPLVGHLEQTPEEKFRTTMMMIQASDDQSLIKAAYDAAKDIPDEKARAQALLDVINEINYFTQQHNG